jgi:hypothetical protein
MPASRLARLARHRDANSGGPPGPLGLPIAQHSNPLSIDFAWIAWNLMEVTYRLPPWLSLRGSYHPRCGNRPLPRAGARDRRAVP